MTLKQIKTATIAELHYAAGRAILSQGDGANFSKMLENRIAAIEKEILKRNNTK